MAGERFPNVRRSRLDHFWTRRELAESLRPQLIEDNRCTCRDRDCQYGTRAAK
jgi:hypothetical protein